MLNERIVTRIGLGVLVLDRQGRVLLANPALIDTLALAGDIVGVDAQTALAAAPAVVELAVRALGAPAPGLDEVGVVIRGELRWLVIHQAPLEDGAGAGGAVLSVLDVTSLRAFEAGRRRAATFAGLAQLSSHVAHELKNPLGALKLYALLLQRQSREGRASSPDLIEKIARAVDHLSAAIGEVTSLAVPEPVEPKVVSPGALLDDGLAGMAERLKAASIEVVRSDDAPGLTAWADARGLGRVIATVIENAIDAMPAGGTLTTGVSPAGPREVALTVQDSGRGIPEDVQARLFEPFVTTKAGGIGLGMALARQVIEQHGGRLEVHSRPGEGTAVRIVLPAGTQAEDHGRRTYPGH